MNAKELIPMETLREVAPVLRAVSHPVRLRIIEVLENGCEATVSELANAAELPQAQTSQQLAILKSHQVIEGRREGQHVHYRLVQAHVCQILQCIRQRPGCTPRDPTDAA